MLVKCHLCLYRLISLHCEGVATLCFFVGCLFGVYPLLIEVKSARFAPFVSGYLPSFFFLCFRWIGHLIINKSYWHKSVLIIIVRFFPLESHNVIFNVTKAITGVVVVLLQCCSRKFIESATFIFAGIEMLRWGRISMIFSSCFERN